MLCYHTVTSSHYHHNSDTSMWFTLQVSIARLLWKEFLVIHWHRHFHCKHLYLLVLCLLQTLSLCLRFDTRDKPPHEGKHWADEALFGGRAYFRHNDSPPTLTLNGAKENDDGVYQCRVDFLESPTRNTRVNLTVIGKLRQQKQILRFAEAQVRLTVAKEHACSKAATNR